MLYYASNRGRQRILEKKKYKTLGEIASLTQIKELMEANSKNQPIRVQSMRPDSITPSVSEVPSVEHKSLHSQNPSVATFQGNSAVPTDD